MAHYLRANLCFFSVFFFMFLGCSSDSNNDNSNDNNVSAKPGKISVTASGITGFYGTGTQYVLIVQVTDTGSSHNSYGVICAMIDADPFDLSSTTVQTTPSDGNPCGTSAGDHSFEPGEYDVGFYIIEAGKQDPDRVTNQQVEVDGDVTIAAPPFNQWTTM